MNQAFDPTSLDPFEQMISDLLRQNSVFRDQVFGPYFDWNIERQGSPYLLCVPISSNNPIYPLAAGRSQRTRIDRFTRQLSIFSTDRALLVNTLIPIVTDALDAIPETPMVDGSVCLDMLMDQQWQVVYEQDKQSNLNVNVHHGWCRFIFRVEKKAGAQ